MLAGSTGKLTAVIRPQKIFTNLGTKITVIIFKNKKKYYMDSSYHGDWDPLDGISFQMI